jgi:hypothetical protein
MSALLLALSFAGTKLLGPERTARAFSTVGRLRRRLKLRTQSRVPSEIDERVQRALRFLPLPVECLDQAMVTWYQLNVDGHPATLKIGMKLAPLAGHAWVVSRGETFVLVPGIEDFSVVAEFPPWP